MPQKPNCNRRLGKALTRLLVIGLLGLATLSGFARDSEVAQLQSRLDALQSAETGLLAPISFGAAQDAVDQLRSRIERGHAADVIERQLRTTRDKVQQAEDAASRAGERYARMLAARQAAAAVNAEEGDARNWRQGERDYERALQALDRGRESSADRMAERAADSFSEAELTTIAAELFGEARAMIEQAERERVDRYAPQRLDTARETLARAEAALAEARYETEGPRLLARQAREQASHARYLSDRIRNARGRGEQEQLLLSMEAPILEIAEMLNVDPDLSAGTAATVTDILNEVRRLQRDLERAELSVQERDERISSLQRMLGGATQERIALSSLLSEQQQRRERLEHAEGLFRHDEAEVLRSGNSLILRLIGLNFATGSDRLESAHESLLERALDAISQFPHAVITVEGHTDSVGNAADNLALSERRAHAVRNWLIEDGGFDEDRIGAAGYGENFPVASNESASGRARNRRIDLVISGIE